MDELSSTTGIVALVAGGVAVIALIWAIALTVQVRIRGDGAAVTARRRVDQTKPGANAEVSIPLAQAPPIGTPVTIDVSVARVPGEEKVDNNKQSYTAIFTR